MAIKTRDELKQYFETNDYPTENQFGDTLDSLRHKNDAIAITDVTGLQTFLNSLPTSTQINNLLAALAPVIGSSNGTIAITFTTRTTIREIEILATADGTCQAGPVAGNDDFGSTDYVHDDVAIILPLKRVYKTGEQLVLTSNTPIDYIIRKA